MVYCNRCGMKASRSLRFCRHCGSRLDLPPLGWQIPAVLHRLDPKRLQRTLTSPEEPRPIEDQGAKDEKTDAHRPTGKLSHSDYLKHKEDQTQPESEKPPPTPQPPSTPQKAPENAIISADPYTPNTDIPSSSVGEAKPRPPLTAPPHPPESSAVSPRQPNAGHDVNMEMEQTMLQAAVRSHIAIAAINEWIEKNMLQATGHSSTKEAPPFAVSPALDQNLEHASAANQTKTLTKPLNDHSIAHAAVVGIATKHALRWRLIVVTSLALLAVGAIALIESATQASPTLAFIGLGLTFWGLIFIFLRPMSYARTELVDSTALSSVKAVDRIISDMGYNGRGVYVPKNGSEWVTLFVPAEKDSSIVPAELEEDSVIQSNPKGVSFVPPGLDLAKVFIEKLSKGKKKVTLDTLQQELPHLFTSDLEIMDDFEMDVNDGVIATKSTNSLYKDFCNEIKLTTRVCRAFGCPICSAVACLLVYATGQPVRLESDETIPQTGRVSETTYRLLPAPQRREQPFSGPRGMRITKLAKTSS